MDRLLTRSRYTLALITALLLANGCAGPLATAVYLIKGTDVPPEFGELKEKRVAVVCRPVGSMYEHERAAQELARRVTWMMQAKMPKADIVDYDEVYQFMDENMWDEFVEIGNALDADAVVGIDLEGFELYEGQTLYKGKARVRVTVIDCKNDGRPIFEKSLPQIVYPPNSVIPTDRMEARQFQREFVDVVADQVGRHFYPHDPYSDYAQDAVVGK